MKKLRILSLLVVTSLFLSACFHSEEAKPEETTDKVTEETKLTEVGVIEFGAEDDAFEMEKIGSVVANKKANIFSESTGYLAAINVGIGDFVEEGQVLAQIEDSTNTEILEINKQFSLKDNALAQKILQSIKESTAEDINVMAVTVDNAWLNYQTLLNNYSSNVDNLNQQVQSAQLTLEQAEEAYDGQSDSYDQSLDNYDINQDNLYETLYKQSQNALSHLQLALDTADLAYGQQHIKNINIRGVLKNQIDYSTYVKADQLYLNTLDALTKAQNKSDQAGKDKDNDKYLDLADTVLDLIDLTEAILLSGDSFLKQLSLSPAQGLDAQVNQFFTKSGQDLAAISQDRVGIKQSLNGIDSSIGGNELQLGNLEDQLTQAELKISAAKLALKQTKNTAQIQYNSLHSQIENAKNLYESSLAQLESLKAKGKTQALQSETSVNATAKQVATTDAQLEGKNITSPISGVVTGLNFKEGNAVNAGQNVITIEDPEQTIIETTATEEELDYIKEGAEVIIRNSNGEESAGEVSSINTFSGVSSLFKIQISITENNNLRNGTLVKLQFNNDQLTSGLFLPMSAVRFQPGKKLLYVVNAENEVEEREIKAGRIIDGSIEVKSGLEIGDRVVIEGIREIQAGDKVNASFKNYLPIPGQFMN